MNNDLLTIQTALKNMNHDPGPVDGVWGRRTKMALASLIENSGRPLALVSDTSITAQELPWIIEAMSMFGKHESRDHAVLKDYLRSDGKTLGDPDKLPWCGDFAETVTKNSLEAEQWPTALFENPYWARNWGLFGKACPALFGAYATFSRNSGGHVGWLVGATTNNYLVLGGNQGDKVSVVPISKKRLLSTRWPLTFPLYNLPLTDKPPLYQLGDTKLGPVSTNEA